MGALLQKQRARDSANERTRPRVPLADVQAHSHEAWGGKFKLQ